MSQVSNTTYVSSIENRYQRAKLNNVIKSISDYVDCSSPDVTTQDYGLLQYDGPIYDGLVIQGDKKPKKANTPVIVSNTYLGNIDINGSLKISNSTLNNSAITTSVSYLNLTYSAQQISSSCSSCFWCDNAQVKCCVTCCNCCDSEGEYIERTTCCTWCWCQHERCVFENAYYGSSAIEFDANLYTQCGSIWTSYDTMTGRLPITCGIDNNYHQYDLITFDESHFDVYDMNRYYFCNNKLYYCGEYEIAGYACISGNSGFYGGWSDGTVTVSATCVGPFMCGFDTSTGKMQWNCNPSNFSMGNYTGGIMASSDTGDGDYISGWYFDAVTSGTFSPNLKRDRLMVCANTCKCCTVCVVSKLRKIDNIHIYERYL